MIESFLVTTAAILITWAIIIVGLTGTGLLVKRIYGLKQISSANFVVSFWVGFAVILCIGQIWNIFLPADGRIWLIIFFLAIGGIVWERQQIWLWLVKISRHWKTIAFFGILVFGLSIEIAFLAAHSTPVHDTGSYHLPVTLWIHTFPVVPGLSNLHSRMGFNSSLFVYAASLSEGIWANRPHHVLMGPLIVMVYLPALIGIKRIFSLSNKFRLADFLAATFIAPAYYIYHWWNYAASLSPNGVIFLLILIGSWLTLIGITRKKNSLKSSGYYLFSAAVIFVAAITIKLTIAPFALVIWLIIAWWSLKGNRVTSKSIRFKSIEWIVVWAFLLIGPWLARGVILSGYPFYPMTIGGTNVNWCVPEIQAELDAAWTCSYSRACYDEPPVGFEWVVPWVKGQFRSIGKSQGLMLPILLLIAAGVIIILFLIFKGRTAFLRIEMPVVWMSGLAIFGLVVWFLTAPDIRFGMGLFWLLACLLTSVVLVLIKQCRCHLVKRITLGIIIVIVAFALIRKVSGLLTKLPDSKYTTWSTNRDNDLVDLINEGLSPLPSVKMWKYTTFSGLQLNVPVEGNQIWDAPFLSSPHPSPGLMLRNPKDISSGFKSEGEWRPYGYPILMYEWHKYVEKRLDEEYKK